MPVPSLASFKVATGETSSATKFNNLVQAVEDEFGSIQADQIPGYPSSVAAFLRGDGAWAGAFSTYVPTWGVLSGTAPTLGNGTIAGRYLQVGKLVYVTITLTWGSTTSAAGAGIWSFSLPVTAQAGTNGPSSMADLLDASASARYKHAAQNETTTLVILWSLASPGGAVTGAITPFTWAVSDVVSISHVYEAA